MFAIIKRYLENLETRIHTSNVYVLERLDREAKRLHDRIALVCQTRYGIKSFEEARIQAEREILKVAQRPSFLHLFDAVSAELPSTKYEKPGNAPAFLDMCWERYDTVRRTKDLIALFPEDSLLRKVLADAPRQHFALLAVDACREVFESHIPPRIHKNIRVSMSGVVHCPLIVYSYTGEDSMLALAVGAYISEYLGLL